MHLHFKRYIPASMLYVKSQYFLEDALRLEKLWSIIYHKFKASETVRVISGKDCTGAI